jgi:hypothetical protein
VQNELIYIAMDCPLVLDLVVAKVPQEKGKKLSNHHHHL